MGSLELNPVEHHSRAPPPLPTVINLAAEHQMWVPSFTSTVIVAAENQMLNPNLQGSGVGGLHLTIILPAEH
jgi:hypothetical protein